MGLQFGNPIPPNIPDFPLFVYGVLIGMGFILFMTFIIDRLGTAMFKRGFAKPFYVKGHRVHHKCIYLIVPAGYSIIIGLFMLGYVHILWHLFWYKVEYTAGLVAATLAIDFLGDKYWPKIRKNVILHHEWLYTLVPAYILTYIVVVVV